MGFYLRKGRTAGQGHISTYDGSASMVSQPLNLSADPIKVDLTGGQAVSVALTPGAYVIHSEVDLYAKSSDSQSLYGLRGLADDRHAQMYETIDPTQYDGLEVGTENFTVEALLGGWTAGVASGGGTFSIEGRDAGGIIGRIWVTWTKTTVEGARVKVALIDNSGTTITAETVVLTEIDPTQRVHMVASLRRNPAGTPIGMVASVNGVTYFDGALADNDSGLPIEFSTGTNIRVTVGGASGGGADYYGDVYFIRAYKRELSSAQVQARAMVAQSSNSRVIDAAYGDMFFEIDFQDQANWADPAHPESSDLTDIDPSYTKIVFNDGNLVAGDVQLADGGDAATDSSAPIKMNDPTPVVVQGNYLSLLSHPGNSGSVWITPV